MVKKGVNQLQPPPELSQYLQKYQLTLARTSALYLPSGAFNSDNPVVENLLPMKLRGDIDLALQYSAKNIETVDIVLNPLSIWSESTKVRIFRQTAPYVEYDIHLMKKYDAERPGAPSENLSDE